MVCLLFYAKPRQKSSLQLLPLYYVKGSLRGEGGALESNLLPFAASCRPACPLFRRASRREAVLDGRGPRLEVSHGMDEHFLWVPTIRKYLWYVVWRVDKYIMWVGRFLQNCVGNSVCFTDNLSARPRAIVTPKNHLS